ncbi:MAG TPA: hypothetical protein VI387_00790 [Candidatus Brocadiales bacterium]|nr:hypothetical protein [Candidatus Brocadiales bacterium]
MSTGRFDFNTDYEAVAASQSDQILGAVGAVGNVLERLIISVATAATSTVSIKDGDGAAIVITAANTPIGVYTVEIGARCVAATTPGWKVTTGAGATVLAVGKFT